jgi:hypothetical protein
LGCVLPVHDMAAGFDVPYTVNVWCFWALKYRCIVWREVVLLGTAVGGRGCCGERAFLDAASPASSAVVGRDYCATMTKHKTNALTICGYASQCQQFFGFNVSPTNASKSSAAANPDLRQLPEIRLDCFGPREGQWKAEGDIFGHTTHWRSASGKLSGGLATMGEVAERGLSRYNFAIFHR